jgi:Zn-dependent peptidase ImmA (M78 family)
MIFPKTLKIGGHTIALKLVDKTENRNCGEWDPFKNLIEIDKNQPMSQQEVTLVHEILHAVCVTLEHDKVEMLSQHLYQVLKDNKLHFDGKDVK